MKFPHSIVRYSGILMLAAAACSCEYKALESLELMLKVSYDWTSCQKVDSMEFRLLPSGGAAPVVSRVLSGTKESNVNAPDGSFHALTYTRKASGVLSRNETSLSFELYTPECTRMPSLEKAPDELPRASGTESEPVVTIPGRVCTADREIVLDAVSVPRPSLTFKPKDVMTDVEVNVLNLGQPDAIDKVAATLSGMAGSFYPITGMPAATPSTLPVEFSTFDRTSGSLGSSFCCFGDCAGSADNHLVLYVTTTDGGCYTYTEKVTDQVEAGAPSRHIVIEIKNIDIPIDGSSFSPSVGGWKEINKEINL